MKFLLFNWDNIESYVGIDDINNLTDDEFMKLVIEDGGRHIYDDPKAFEQAFNEELFGTATHQLRIIDDSIRINWDVIPAEEIEKFKTNFPQYRTMYKTIFLGDVPDEELFKKSS